MSLLEPSANFAFAVNCWVFGPAKPLTEIWATVGVIEIDVTAELVTVTVAVPLTVPEVAVMVEVPAATPVTRPFVLMVATVASEALHLRLDKWLALLPSALTPVADNCTVCPFTTEGLAGEIVML